MPYLKTVSITATSATVRETFKVRVSVSSAGKFYCHAPSYLSLAAKNHFSHGERGIVNDEKQTVELAKGTLHELVAALTDSLRDAVTPIVTEEHIIRYNIESRISFAEDDEGNIYPNASYEGAAWINDPHNKYGQLHSSQRSKGGYSLTIGAIALTKSTVSYGEQKRVSYKKYYKGGGSFSQDNPASRLNSWVSFDLLNQDNYKEIPYSDESADFFFDLISSMARLSKFIQGHTFDEATLLETIAQGQRLLAPKKP